MRDEDSVDDGVGGGWIRLQSYNGVTWYVQRLRAKKNPATAALVTKGHRVKMRIRDWYDDNEGGYGNSVLTMAPRRRLRAGKTYKLVLTHRLPKGGVKKYTLGSWKVSSKVDRRAPKWKGKPVMASRKTTYYGTVPSVICWRRP